MVGVMQLLKAMQKSPIFIRTRKPADAEEFKWNRIDIGSGKDLWPGRWQAIICTMMAPGTGFAVLAYTRVTLYTT